MCHSFTSQSKTVGVIAMDEFPDDWPELFPQLKGGLESTEPVHVYGAMNGFAGNTAGYVSPPSHHETVLTDTTAKESKAMILSLAPILLQLIQSDVRVDCSSPADDCPV